MLAVGMSMLANLASGHEDNGGYYGGIFKAGTVRIAC